MSENNHPQPKQNQQLDDLLDLYFSKYSRHRQRCYPGLIFWQGKRKMVQINVPAYELPTLLQAKPSRDNDPDSGKNRPEVKGHADEIKQYIIQRIKKDKPWLLGTLTANIAPDKIYITELGSMGICLVYIPPNVKLDITDGQHRKSAIHQLVESPEGDLFAHNHFPITLVLEADFNQCQADFRDMAQAKELDKSLLLSFGEFEGRVGITKKIIEEVPMFSGKTERIKRTPSSQKKFIYTINYIAKAVSCAFADKTNDELKDYDVESCSEALASCLNHFFRESRQTRHIFETNAANLTVEDVDAFKNNSLLGRSVGLEILGRLLYCIYDEESVCFDTDKVSEIAKLDWSRTSSLWDNNVVLSNHNTKDSTNEYKITASANAVKIAVSVAKAHLGWT